MDKYKSIFLLLAQQRNVCHVLKEFVINDGYGTITIKLSEYGKSSFL